MARPPRGALRLLLGACTSAAALLSFAVEAQQHTVGRFALDRFEPTPVGDRFFAVPSAGVDGEVAPRGGLSFGYAYNPLVLRSETSGEVIGSVVSDQAALHAAGSLALWHRVLLSLDLPLYVVNEGDDPADTRSAAASPSAASLGDVRIGARVKVFGETRGPLEIGIANYIWLPTGDPREYTGDDGARSMPHLAVGGTLRSFVLAAHVGVMIRRSVEVLDVGVGSELGGGLAAGVEVIPQLLLLGGELVASTAVAGSARGRDVEPFDESTSYAEVHACSRLEVGGFAFGIAAGPGLTNGVGAPVFRAIATVQYGAESPVSTPRSSTDRELAREPHGD